MQFRDPSLMWSSFKQSAGKRLNAASELASQAAAAAQEVIAAAAEEESSQYEYGRHDENASIPGNDSADASSPRSTTAIPGSAQFEESRPHDLFERKKDTSNDGDGSFGFLGGIFPAPTIPVASSSSSRPVLPFSGSRPGDPRQMELKSARNIDINSENIIHADNAVDSGEERTPNAERDTKHSSAPEQETRVGSHGNEMPDLEEKASAENKALFDLNAFEQIPDSGKVQVDTFLPGKTDENVFLEHSALTSNDAGKPLHVSVEASGIEKNTQSMNALFSTATDGSTTLPENGRFEIPGGGEGDYGSWFKFEETFESRETCSTDSGSAKPSSLHTADLGGNTPAPSTSEAHISQNEKDVCFTANCSASDSRITAESTADFSCSAETIDRGHEEASNKNQLYPAAGADARTDAAGFLDTANSGVFASGAQAEHEASRDNANVPNSRSESLMDADREQSLAKTESNGSVGVSWFDNNQVFPEADVHERNDQVAFWSDLDVKTLSDAYQSRTDDFVKPDQVAVEAAFGEQNATLSPAFENPHNCAPFDKGVTVPDHSTFLGSNEADTDVSTPVERAKVHQEPFQLDAAPVSAMHLNSDHSKALTLGHELSLDGDDRRSAVQSDSSQNVDQSQLFDTDEAQALPVSSEFREVQSIFDPSTTEPTTNSADQHSTAFEFSGIEFPNFSDSVAAESSDYGQEGTPTNFFPSHVDSNARVEDMHDYSRDDVTRPDGRSAAKEEAFFSSVGDSEGFPPQFPGSEVNMNDEQVSNMAEKDRDDVAEEACDTEGVVSRNQLFPRNLEADAKTVSLTEDEHSTISLGGALNTDAESNVDDAWEHLAPVKDADKDCVPEEHGSHHLLPAGQRRTTLGNDRIIAWLSDELKKVQDERDAALTKLALLENHRATDKEKQLALQSEVRMVKDELDLLVENRENMTKKFEDILAQRGSDRDARSELTDPIQSESRIHHEVSATQKAFADISASSEARFAELKAGLESICKEHESMINQRSRWMARFIEFEEKQRGASAKLVDAECRIVALKSERDIAVEQCSLLREQSQALQEQLPKPLGSHDSLSGLTSAAASSGSPAQEKSQRESSNFSSSVQEELLAYGERVEKLIAQRGVIQRQRDDTGKRLVAAGAEFSRLQNIIKESNAERNRLQDDLLSATRRNHELESQNVTLSESLARNEIIAAQLEDLKEQLSEECLDSQTVRATNVNLSGKCEELENEIDLLKYRNHATSLDCDNMRSKYAALEKELDRRRQTLEDMTDKLALSAAETVGLQSQIECMKVDAEQKMKMLLSERENAVRHCEALASCKSLLQSHLNQQSTVLSKAISSLYQILHNVEVIPTDTVFPPSCVSRSCTSPSLVSSGACSRDEMAETDTLALRAAQTDLAAQNEDISDKFERLGAYCRKQVKAVEELTEENSKLKLELRTSIAHAQAVESDNDTLNGKLNWLEENVRALEIERDEVRNSANQYAKDISLLQESSVPAQDYRDIQEHLGRALSDLADLGKTLEEFTSSYSDAFDVNIAHDSNDGLLAGLTTILEAFSQNLDERHSIEQHCKHLEGLASQAKTEADRLRESLKTANGELQRLQAESLSVRDEVIQEFRPNYESLISSLEDELGSVRNDLSATRDMLSRAQQEVENLRDLCSKLTSQFNSRTNELDDAEEKVVFLQDQVASLEDDLEDLRRRSQERAVESADARQSEVDELASELQTERDRCQQLEVSVVSLREKLNDAKSSLRETSMLANTHQEAAKNLQIAIEQLEAEKDADIELKTAALNAQLQEARAGGEDCTKLKLVAQQAENEVSVLRKEISEQRSALQRLADERVELKLELEEKLSRLNHPDSNDQLVDRRVVRQLLVSYFRVDSLRKREVLELMSRMLVFSEEDLTTVGLKKIALMDRLGAVVHSPRTTTPSIPVQSVSEKWIEFLMNESVDEVEQDDF